MNRLRPSLALVVLAALLAACGRGGDEQQLMRRVAQAEAAAAKAEAAQQRAETAATKAVSEADPAEGDDEEQDADKDEDDDEDVDADVEVFDNDIVSPPEPAQTMVTEAAPPPVQG